MTLSKLLSGLLDVAMLLVYLTCLAVIGSFLVGGTVSFFVGTGEFLRAPIGFKEPSELSGTWVPVAFFGGGIVFLLGFGILYLILWLEERLETQK